MTKRVERFRSRRARLDSRVGDLPPPIADADLVQGMLSQEIDWSLIDSLAIKAPAFNDVVVTDEEVTRCLSDLDNAFSRQKYDALFEGVKDTLIDQLLRSAKLYPVLKDKKFKDLDFKDLDDKFISENKYDSNDYAHGQPFRNEVMKERKNPDGTITDAFSGKHYGASSGKHYDASSGKHYDRSQVDLHHVISKEEFHNEYDGHLLYPEEREAWAKERGNVVFIDQSTNKSIGSGSSTGHGDGRRINPAEKRGRDISEKYRPKGLDRVRRAADIYGIKAGTRQGLQQSLALLVSELISAVLRK